MMPVDDAMLEIRRGAEEILVESELVENYHQVNHCE